MKNTVNAILESLSINKINESKLTPAKVSWYGSSNVTMPDGTEEMTGDSKYVSVHTLFDSGHYCVVALMGKWDEHYMQKCDFKTSDDANKFAEKLLNQIKDDEDPEATAREFKMEYSYQPE